MNFEGTHSVHFKAQMVSLENSTKHLNNSDSTLPLPETERRKVSRSTLIGLAQLMQPWLTQWLWSEE